MSKVSRTVADLFEGITLAAGCAGAGTPALNNAHIHLPPNFSAFETVEQAVGLSQAQGVGILGVSNYYHYGVYADFARRCRAAGIFPLFGTEIIALLDDLVAAGVRINDPGNPGKMYLCGKGIVSFDPPAERATELLNVIRQKDSSRMAAAVDALGQVFAAAGFSAGIDEAAVKAMIVRRHGCAPETVFIQERHITQAFQEALAGLAPDERAAVLCRAYGAESRIAPNDGVGLQNEIRANLLKAGKPAYVPETFVGFEHARDLILALGGIPCYPVVADGARPVCAFEETVEGLIDRLAGLGLVCAEFIPDRNSPETLAAYVLPMRAAGIVITAGTEHNTLDLIPIAPACKGGAPIPSEVAAIFHEGACVVAGHQYAVCTGQAGFVGPDGAPYPLHGAAEERIATFRALGEAAIAAALA